VTPASVSELVRASRQAELECLVALACKAFAVPVACVAFADGQIVSHTEPAGADCRSVTGDSVLCNLALAGGRSLVVADTALDARFAGRRLHPGGPPVRFYAGVPVAVGRRGGGATLCIFDVEPRQLQPADERQLHELANVVAALIEQSRQTRNVDRLVDALAAKARQSSENYESFARYKKMYERSSALAKIGVWECNLEDEALSWTDGVYDIFELPRGSRVTREMILDLYYDESRRALQELRRKAIAECASFCLDIKVRTAKGRTRWVRLSADVEAEDGVPVRIFGLKQDITQERMLLDRLRQLAEYDPLTGLANRRMFERVFAGTLAAKPRSGALLQLVLVDLDGFKAVNDTFGHAAGDACLKEAAKRLRRLVKRPNVIGRIGGDEFALLIAGQSSVRNIAATVQKIVAEIGRPIRLDGAWLEVGASAGASAPRVLAECTLNTMFAEADRALYEAKHAGRNTYRIFGAGRVGRAMP